MIRHTPTTPRKANMIFIICLILAVLLCSVIASAQDRYSIQLTTDNVIFQKGIFYGGVEFNAEFNNHIYVRPQIHYAALKDGYFETSAGIGYHFTYKKEKEYNFKPLNYILDSLDKRLSFKSGVKIGLIHRAATYPIFGVEGSIEYHFTDKFGIGLRGSYDARGDADFYDGNKWVYNSQVYLKFKL